MKRIVSLLVPLSFILAVIGTGCYTVIMHPKNQRDYRASQVSDCTRCHLNYGVYPYGHYYAPDPEYWWDYPVYVGYYAEPWWWNYYEYPYLDDQKVNRATKFNRRDGPGEPLLPPYALPGSDGYPPRPDVMNLPSEYQDTGNSADDHQARPGNPSSDSQSRSKDPEKSYAPVKNTRGSSPSEATKGESRPQPKATPSEPDESPEKTDPPPDEPQPETGTKKSGDPGGGR